ncbi:hypothetical protein OV079_02390 [Nannocystis pusilla]|uniref:Uncharacterized protein n=1 Tax=Nannocystis pusilla TaxID=889268 RepID=A0A9X3EJM3_9BACT|nr:hypothetical protein [Nannocystis pusilla]MCY1004434.1 hypothetical protein [Nannocystis pusilla]
MLQRQIQERPVADHAATQSEGTSRQAVEAEVDQPNAEAAQDFDSEKQSSDITKPEGDVDIGHPHWPAAATEHEVAQAIELVSKFAGEVDVHHQRQLRRVVSLEQTVSTMRALVLREPNSMGASPYG